MISGDAKEAISFRGNFPIHSRTRNMEKAIRKWLGAQQLNSSQAFRIKTGIRGMMDSIALDKEISLLSSVTNCSECMKSSESLSLTASWVNEFNSISELQQFTGLEFIDEMSENDIGSLALGLR